jgi:hypothetical protein
VGSGSVAGEDLWGFGAGLCAILDSEEVGCLGWEVYVVGFMCCGLGC